MRLNRDLLSEQTQKMDVVDILESDLTLSREAMVRLVEDVKDVQAKKKRLSRADISRYEQKSRSIISETSAIMEDRKMTSKCKKQNLEAQKLEEMIEAQEELRLIKLDNQILKKVIEKEKKGIPSFTSVGTSPNQFKEATGGTEFISFQNNEMLPDNGREGVAFTFHTPALLVEPVGHKPGKLHKYLKILNRKLVSDISSLKEGNKEHKHNWRKFNCALESGLLKTGFTEDGYVAFLLGLTSEAHLKREQHNSALRLAERITPCKLGVVQEVLLDEVSETQTKQSELPASGHTTDVEPLPDLWELQEQLAREMEVQQRLSTELSIASKRTKVLQEARVKLQSENNRLRDLAATETRLLAEIGEIRSEIQLLSEV